MTRLLATSVKMEASAAFEDALRLFRAMRDSEAYAVLKLAAMALMESDLLPTDGYVASKHELIAHRIGVVTVRVSQLQDKHAPILP